MSCVVEKGTWSVCTQVVGSAVRSPFPRQQEPEGGFQQGLVGSKLRFQTAIVVAVMDQDWGVRKADPRFLARSQVEELPGRWGAGQGGQGLSPGHAGQSSLGTQWLVPGDRAGPEE